jgi:hypothetical protein
MTYTYKQIRAEGWLFVNFIAMLAYDKLSVIRGLFFHYATKAAPRLNLYTVGERNLSPHYFLKPMHYADFITYTSSTNTKSH